MSIVFRSVKARLLLAAPLALAAALVIAPVQAQDEVVEPSIVILPVDRAQFLPGAYFDFRVEVSGESLPDNFSVSVNGVEASGFFGAEPTEETWEHGDVEVAPLTPVASVIWRDLSAPEPGEYTIEATAGDVTESVNWTVREPAEAQARNVILLIADGMSVPEISAARIASLGTTQGKVNGQLAMDTMEEIGLAQTGSIDTIMADSANTASALNTGHKGAVNATGTYSDTSPDTFDDPRVETLAEMLIRTRGMAIGIVTTADYTDATPAAVWAHGRNRSTTNRAAYAVQALEMGPQVILGGGGQYLLPSTAEGSRRADERDLFTEYEAAGYTVVTSATELQDALGETPDRLFGIFHPRDMNVWLDRNVYTDNVGDFTDQPGLEAMTLAALDVLNQNPNGFYLEVESGSVDKQMHPLDQERALSELIEFDQTVGAVLEWVAANAPDTLVVVTADHGHGYDVYGTVDTTVFNAGTTDAERREAIGVYQDAGFPDYQDANGDGQPEWEDATITFAGAVNNHPDYTEDFQVSTTPRVPAIANEAGEYIDNPDDDPNGIVMTGNMALDSSTGVHTLQDAPVFASGPGSEWFGRSYDQTEIFFGMANALGLDPREAAQS